MYNKNHLNANRAMLARTHVARVDPNYHGEIVQFGLADGHICHPSAVEEVLHDPAALALAFRAVEMAAPQQYAAGNMRRNISPSMGAGGRYKGNWNSSDVVVGGSSPITTLVLPWSGNSRARMTGTVMATLQLVLLNSTGNFPSPIQLQSIRTTLRINGSDVDEVREVPALQMTPTIDGQTQAIMVGVRIPEDASFDLVVQSPSAAIADMAGWTAQALAVGVADDAQVFIGS